MEHADAPDKDGWRDQVEEGEEWKRGRGGEDSSVRVKIERNERK